jgi:NAD(P)-dependent dehydrogenase (short-subunit alcohol dehydrogenase family)
MNDANPKPGRPVGLVAIITGGAGGIGQATALALARAGARVVAADLPGPKLDAATRAFAASGMSPMITVMPMDVTQEADTARVADETARRFGRIDVLVTSAGILRAPGTLPKPLADTTPAEWQIVIDVNLRGVFLSNRAVLAHMIANRSGLIINVSSTSGRQGRAHDAPYCASKFGVVGLSEALAEEVRHRGIRVQTIFPDAVDTPLWEQNGPIKPEYALAPERVADLIAFMVALPEDTQLVAPAIAPFRTRRRKAKSPPAEVTAVAAVTDGAA